MVQVHSGLASCFHSKSNCCSSHPQPETLPGPCHLIVLFPVSRWAHGFPPRPASRDSRGHCRPSTCPCQTRRLLHTCLPLACVQAAPRPGNPHLSLQSRHWANTAQASTVPLDHPPGPLALCSAPYTATGCHGKHSTIFSLALLKQPTTTMPPKLPRCSAALSRKHSQQRGLWDLHGSPAPFPASPPTLPALTWPPGPSFHMGRPICSDGQRPLSPAMPCAPPSPNSCCPPSTSSQLRSHFQGRPRAQARRGPCHLAL